MQNELANSLVQNPLGERAANIEQALHHYQQALEVYTRADFPVGWAMAQNNLATAYCERIRGERVANLEQAIQHYRQALEVRTAEALPADHLQTQRNLGYLHFGEGRWDQAHHAYDGAIVVGRSLLQAAYSEVGRQAEVAETALLYAHAAYCLVQMGDCGAALAQLEAGKTRLLAEALALSEADTTTLTKEHRQTLSDIRQHIRDLETECRLPANTPARRSERQITAELHETRAELNQLIDAIRVLHPDFMPEGLDLPGILALIAPDEVLVAPLFTPQGSAVFAVPPGMDKVTEEDAIPLDDFTDADLNRLLVGTEGDPGWLRAYFSRKDDLRNWLERLDMLTGRLWDRILAPIHNRLQVLGAKRVIFIPQGGLGVLPLHAAWRMENEQKRYFIDDYIARYAPSAYALDTARRRLSRYDGQRSALVGGIQEYRHYNKDMNDLPNARAEAEAIVALFEAPPLVDEQVTPIAVLEGAPGSAYLHLSCHGAFAWGDTLRSALFRNYSGQNVLT